MIRAFVLALAVSVALVMPARAEENSAQRVTDQQELIERAALTARTMIAKPENKDLRRLLGRAKAVLIVPRLLKAGFFLGGEGGDGVILARSASGAWTAPAFYGMAGASIGIQFGGQSSEVMLLIMSDKGLKALINRRVSLGGEAGLALGTLGKGVSAASGMDLDADVYAFSESQGLFGGAALEGSYLAELSDWNAAFYGAGATAKGILLDNAFDRPGTQALRDALQQ